MTQDAQRIAIAKACGITGYLHDLPDYLNDLNAMHEAEKTLSPIQLSYYESELVEMCNLKSAASMVSAYRWHATAAQRAKSFLLALSLWRDDA